MEISKDYKVCASQKAVDCVKLGPPTSFHARTKVCKKCHTIYKAEYYQLNKVKLNKNVMIKYRQKRAIAKENLPLLKQLPLNI